MDELFEDIASIGCLEKSPAAFRYFGGKNMITSWIVSKFPMHKAFVDVFGGTGAIIMNKPKVDVNIYNDLNGDIVNFFRVVRDQPQRFIDYIELIPYSREEYYTFLEKMKTETDSFLRAIYFFYLQNCSFAGKSGSFGYSIKRSNYWSNNDERIMRVSEKFKLTTIEHLDFREMFNRYDRDKNALFYCDPPYMADTRTDKAYYKDEMTKDDHEDLLKLVTTATGKIAISGYETELYMDYLKDFKLYQKDVPMHSCGMVKSYDQDTHPRKMECLWVKDTV
jgi:DNA adenine methylase